MLRRKFLMAVAAAAVAGLLGPASARAGFEFKVTQGGDSATYDLTAGGATLLSSSGSGANLTGYSPVFGSLPNGKNQASFTIQIGDYLISTQTAISNVPGTSNVGVLNIEDTTVFRATTNNINPLVVELTGSGFVNPPPAGGYTFNSAFSGRFESTENAGQTVKIESAFAEGTSLFDYSGTVSTSMLTSTGVPAAPYTLTPPSSSISLPLGVAPFSLANRLTFNLSGGGTASQAGVDSSITPAPAPATAILALAGAPIFGVFGWMRRRKAVVA